MGNRNSVSHFSTKQKQLLVRTGIQGGKGTDANIQVVLHDKSGRKTKPISLDCKFRDDFESGQMDNFPIDLRSEDGNPINDVTEIELWRDKVGLSSDWFCDVIILLDPETGHSVPFPVTRWVKPNFRYKIKCHDTLLPQDDPNRPQRTLELDYKRTLYEYSGKDKELPGAIDKLPKDEEFSLKYFLEVLVKPSAKATITNFFTKLRLPRQWRSVDDIKKAFDNQTFELPKSAEWWNDDEWFAAQRLAGVHPCTIELCTEIPNDFAVNEEDIRPHLENRALNDVVRDKKLFIVDYRVFDGLQGKKNFTVVSPMCLFYLNSEGTLLPVAIQLFAKPGPENPVFYPSDDINVWTSAKLWFGMADANFHEAVAHLGLTHLAMEASSIATHRSLAPNHPVFRLLAPHFFYLFAINVSGLPILFDEGGAFDTVMNIGSKGSKQMIRKMWGNWRLNVEGTLPKAMENRGVLDETVLPNYPYRDDGILVYNAIKDYVTNVLKIYYGDGSKIQNDDELQSWGKFLSTSVENGGGGIKGVPNDGHFTSLDDIITTCTSLIFTCSVQHAAVNFAQYDIYAFPPNMPTMMRGQPPKNKNPISERAYLKQLADKSTLLFGMRLAQTLSGRGTRSLGEWDIRFQYDREAVAVEKRFREELLKVSEKIKERNKSRSKYYQYDYLDPEFIPNSISI